MVLQATLFVRVGLQGGPRRNGNVFVGRHGGVGLSSEDGDTYIASPARWAAASGCRQIPAAVPDDKSDIPTLRSAPVSSAAHRLPFLPFSHPSLLRPDPQSPSLDQLSLWFPQGSLLSCTPSFLSPFYPLQRMVVSLHPLSTSNIPSYFPPTDFQVTYPTKGAQLANGQTYPITWEKGLLDGVNFFDLELTRMNTNGLILIARDSASQMAFLCRPLRTIEATFPLSSF